MWKFEKIWLKGTLIITRKPKVWRVEEWTDGRTKEHEDSWIPPTLVERGNKKNEGIEKINCFNTLVSNNFYSVNYFVSAKPCDLGGMLGAGVNVHNENSNR
jgi:hypothetical protein